MVNTMMSMMEVKPTLVHQTIRPVIRKERTPTTCKLKLALMFSYFAKLKNSAGGYKATLKNPNVSDEAKQHAQEQLDQMQK